MKSKTILLVEDNPDDELLTIRALKKNDAHQEITVARDGREALDYLLDEAKPLPALVLLDLRLPKVTGLEVLKTARSTARTALTPIVVLTTSNDVPDLMDSYRAGCNSYLRKAIDFAQFTEMMRQTQQFWLNLNEPPPKNK